jgi:hypothetical protein
MKNNFSVVAFALLLLLCPFVRGQQVQTHDVSNPEEIYATNSEWVQGVGPGYWATAGSGLTLNIAAGTCFDSVGTRHTYAGGTITVTNSATNYVDLKDSDCSIEQSTSAYQSRTPIAQVVASGGAITTVTDDRTWFVKAVAQYILQVNASALTWGDTVNFNDTTPVAGSNGLNIKWQKSTSGGTDSVSGYVPGDGTSTHFLSGVGTWTVPAGTGTVTSVGLTVNSTSPSGIFTVTGSPVTGGGTLNFNLAGTSGGHPYFSSSTVLSSTTAQTAHGIWLAQGAGNADVSTGAGTAKQILVAGGSGADPSYVDFPEHKIIPAANCNNTTAGNGWSIPASNAPTVACRAGTNNLGGVLSWANNNTTTNAQFLFELPLDWDTATQPYINIIYSSGANTSGTVKWTFSSACTKSDGSVTDDPSFNAESATSGQTMAAANRTWAESTQFTALTSGNNCIGGSSVIVKVTSGNGTASSVVKVYQVTLTIPRLLTVQAN